MSDTLTLSVQANADTSHAADVISQVYRQVFGNRHLMELDVNPSLEALFMNGDLSVQGFVTALAQSETVPKPGTWLTVRRPDSSNRSGLREARAP